jgi:hypothetical protein
MLLIAMAAAAQLAAPETLELMCTYRRYGGETAQLIFTIDESTKTFTGKADDAHPFSGTADATTDTFILADADGKVSYRISRTSGAFELDLGLPNTSPVLRLKGSCEKYTGRLF